MSQLAGPAYDIADALIARLAMLPPPEGEATPQERNDASVALICAVSYATHHGVTVEDVVGALQERSVPTEGVTVPDINDELAHHAQPNA